MKFGIHYIYWQKNLDCKSYIPHVQNAAKTGFDVLELGDYLLLDMSNEEIDELEKLAKKLKVELLLGIDLPQDCSLTSDDPATRNAGIDFYKNVFVKAERLGIKKINGQFLNAAPCAPNAPKREGELQNGVDSVRKIGLEAQKHGITICVEAANRFEAHLINTAKQGCEFIDQVNLPNVKLLLDSFHMNIEESSFTEAILTAGDRLGHFHFVENHRGLPGTGHIPWTEIRDALKAINYEGILSMEALVLAGGQLGDAVFVWRDLVESTDVNDMNEEAAASLQTMKFLFVNGGR